MTESAYDIFKERLPEDPAEAIKFMIQRGLELEGALIEEEKALEAKDAKAFQLSQDKKNRRFMRYDMAAGDFKYNIEKFKDVDDELISQFTAVQKKIKDQTQRNIDIMTNLIDNAQAEHLGIDPADIETIKKQQKEEQQND